MPQRSKTDMVKAKKCLIVPIFAEVASKRRYFAGSEANRVACAAASFATGTRKGEQET